MSGSALPGRVASRGAASGVLVRDVPRIARPGRPVNGVIGAIAQTLEQLRALQARSGELASGIVQFQIEMLEDDRFVLELLQAAIAGGSEQAAVARLLDEQIADFAGSGSETFSARAADLTDLRDRLLAALTGDVRELPDLPDDTILLADDMAPSRFLELDFAKVKGIVDQRGSTASHVALLARSEAVPMLVATGPVDRALEGTLVTLDGVSGVLAIGSDIASVEHAASAPPNFPEIADSEGEGAAFLPGGERVKVNLIVNTLAGLDEAPRDWFDGIGLVRTELLIGDPVVPRCEETQVGLYRPIFDWARGLPVSFRLFDAGGDKAVPGLDVPAEANPFLGLRGARFLMRRPGIVERQLRAILRAAAGRPLRILVPMVTLPREMAFFREALADAAADVGVNGAEIPLGMMVETPAAAIAIESFDADFYALGTNDLVQYTLAVSRDSDALDRGTEVAQAVMRLVRQVVDHGASTGREVTLCGDIASSPTQVAQLLDCGVRSFSTPKRFAPRFKHLIRTGE